MNVFHAAYCFGTNPDGIPFDARSMLIGGIFESALVLLLLWLARSVYAGKRLVGTAILLGWLTLSWILIPLILVLTGEYPAPADLVLVQACLFASILAAFVAVLRAMASRGRDSVQEKGEENVPV